MVAVVLDDNKIKDDGDSKENVKKQYVYVNKQQLCTWITLFCTFICRRCTTTTWNFLISRTALWSRSTQHKNCRFLFLNLGKKTHTHTIDTVPKKIFAKICQIKWNWIRSVSNGNRTVWSPIGSVIIRVINKIGRPRSGSPICLIASMIIDRIGRHEVLLPINHNFHKICDIIGYFLKQKTRNSKFVLLAVKKKAIYAHTWWRVMCNYLGMTRTIKLSN